MILRISEWTIRKNICMAYSDAFWYSVKNAKKNTKLNLDVCSISNKIRCLVEYCCIDFIIKFL